MPEGTPLYAVKDGVVSYVDNYNNYDGMGVIVRTDAGEEFIYWHVSSIAVSAGQRARMGEVVALSGNTGQSTGPHLHFGERLNGQLVDPSPYLSTEGGADMLNPSQLSKLWYLAFHHDIDEGGRWKWGPRPAGEIIDYLDTTDAHKQVADAYTIELPALRDRVAGEHARTQAATDVAVTAATAPLEAKIKRLEDGIRLLEAQPPKLITDPTQLSFGQLLSELVTRIFRPKGGERT